MVITAIPPNHSAARTAVRIDEATPYQNSPDSFPVNKADLDMVMMGTPVAQHLFNTSEALIEAPYNKTNVYPASHFIKAVKKYEADSWQIAAAWIYREDQKHVKGGGYFAEDLRVLSGGRTRQCAHRHPQFDYPVQGCQIDSVTGGGHPFFPSLARS